ncbi:MAG: class I SAM-dependent methyltransferase [Actinomycetota bacterium]|nr:class I SAM-dependent methyltransferase [Actinomycetota bacterium]
MDDNAPAEGKTARRRLPRHVVVRRLLSSYADPRYLEVGVFRGVTFDRVEAATKVAVDPNFQFDPTDPARARPGVSYHPVTSDEYFGSIVEPGELFDVIFLDGLHTVEQTLRDLLNALAHLQPQGVILVDDVRPPTYIASLRSHQRFAKVRAKIGAQENQWMGDVYRLMYFIDTFCQQLTYRTISNNHGQAVIWRKRRPSVTERTLTEVGQLTFEEFCLTDDVLRSAPLGRIEPEMRADLGLTRLDR